MFGSQVRVKAGVCACLLSVLAAASAALAQEAPSNDSCFSAIALGPGLTAGTTNGATSDGPSGCGSTEGAPDVWYRYVPSADGILDVTTCSGSDYDTVLSAFYACQCPPSIGSQIICNDDSDTSGCDQYRSTITFPVTAGTPYLIRVSGFEGATGIFTLTVTGPVPGPVLDSDHDGIPDACANLATVPVNDNCSDATVIGPGTYVGSTLLATGDGQSSSCDNDGVRDVWYRYVPATNGTISVDTIGSTFDTVLSVFQFACSCPPTDELACNDDCDIVKGDFRQSCLTADVTAGVCYLIRITGYEEDEAGPYVLTLSGPPLATLPDDNHDGVPDPCQPCTVTCPGNLTAYSVPGNDSVVVYYDVSITGSCDPALSLDCDHPSGSSFPIGDTLVTCCLRDPDPLGKGKPGPCGGCCSFTVSVIPGEDCNNNGVGDITDILNGTSLDCNCDQIPDECQGCCWDNGRIPTPEAVPSGPLVNGELSHEGGGAGDASRVADDVYFCPGQIHKVTAFFGQMITNSYFDKAVDFRHARLDVFEDCDGKPVQTPFKSFTNSVIVNSVDLPDGYTLVTYRFDLCDEHLWLDGGTWWFSLIGLSDNVNNDDLSFWAATTPTPNPEGLIGSVPVRANGTRNHQHWMTFDYGPWVPISDCCLGCVNMAFWLSCETCEVVWDNGPADLDPLSKGGSPSGAAGPNEAETADQFVVNPCQDREVCLIQAWVWSNCVLTPDQLDHPCDCAFINLYRNDCNLPLLTNPCYLQLRPSRIRALPATTTIDNRLVHLYCLEFETNPCGRFQVGGQSSITLYAGNTYWISAGIHGNGTIATRSYFAYNSVCPPACPTRIHPGVTRTISSTGIISPWTPTTHDFAFKFDGLIGDAVIRANNGQPGNGGPAPCAVDINHDGSATIGDIFAFLTVWFAGCP